MTAIERNRQQLKILISMYLGYGAMMVCRQMVTILSPAMLADESLGLTKTHIGDFAAYGTLGALTGKLIWGPLADRIGGRMTFLIGLVITAIFVAAFGMSPNVGAFTFFAFLLYCTKSSGWPGMTKLVGEWFQPKKYGRVWGILSTSSRASVVLGTLFFGWLLSVLPWRQVAYTSAGFAVLIFVFCYFFLLDRPTDPDFFSGEDSEDDARTENKLHHPLGGASLLTALKDFATSSRVWLVIIMLMVLTCMMAFLDFVPVFLMEVYSLTPSQASMASSIFPLGSLSGLILCIFFYDRFSFKGLRRVLSIALAIATGCVLIIQHLPSFGLGESTNFIIVLSMIFLFGLMISPSYYIPMSVFSIEYGGPHSATLVCLIDAFGFAASASFGFVGGRLADSSGGWDSFMNLLLSIAVVATVSVWAFLHSEYKANKTANN